MFRSRTIRQRVLLGTLALFAGATSGASAYFGRRISDVDLADFAEFQGCFGTTTPDCLAVFDFDADGQSDESVDLADLVGFEHWLRGPNLLPGGGCPTIPQGRCSGRRLAGRGIRNNLPPSGTFALHGRPIDVLSDGHVLFYIRARYYDPVNGRWLQRDPTGYADGNDLYEAFASNATAKTDPDGKYTKLASGWNNGDEMFYQRILPFAGITREFSVGSYRYVNGEKFVVYDEDVEGRGYTYVMSLRQVERWAKNVADQSDYEFFVRLNAVALDRFTGEPVRRSLGEAFARSVAGIMEQEHERLEGLIGSFEPMTFIATPAMMALTGEDIAREVSVPGRFRVLGAGITALEMAPGVQIAGRTLGVGGRGLSQAARARVSYWRLPPVVRGEAIERMLGQNLPRTFPTIDRFRSGVATSIKSLDLMAPSYANPITLERVVRGYIDDVAAFRGGVWAGREIHQRRITGRVLDLAIPRGAATVEQRATLDALVRYGQQRGVVVSIVEIP